MGYRSDVAYVIKFESIEKRDAYVGLVLAKGDECAKAMEECAYSYKRDPIITFHAEDVKWYDSYADVQAHTENYQEAYKVVGAAYRFLAIGEDGAETFDQEDGAYDLDDYIRAVHYLEVDFPALAPEDEQRIVDVFDEFLTSNKGE
jgi:hypothetical protein